MDEVIKIKKIDKALLIYFTAGINKASREVGNIFLL